MTHQFKVGDRIKLVKHKKTEWRMVKFGMGYYLYRNNNLVADFYEHHTLARKVAKWLNEEGKLNDTHS